MEVSLSVLGQIHFNLKSFMTLDFEKQSHFSLLLLSSFLRKSIIWVILVAKYSVSYAIEKSGSGVISTKPDDDFIGSKHVALKILIVSKPKNLV